MKKRILALVLALTLLVLTAGCASTASSKTSSADTTAEPLKIACLAPSFLAILTDLGLSDSIVVVDTNTQTSLGFGADLPAIDMMSPSAETLATLDLDIVFATDMTMGGTAEDPFKVLSDSGVQVEYFASSTSIAAIKTDILRVAEIVGKTAEGQTIVDEMQTAIDEISAETAKMTTKKTVYFEISPADSYYSFGSGVFLNEMIEIAGGINIFAASTSWTSISEEQIIAGNPDVIFTNVNYTGIDEVASIKAREGWSSVNAIKNGNVFYIDNNSSSQPNQSITKALKEMADAIQSAK